MTAFSHAVLAVVAAALTACASPQMARDNLNVDRPVVAAVTPSPAAVPVVSDFDTMRAALPTFDLQQSDSVAAQRGRISVVRDLRFTAESFILAQADVKRLVPLQAYLRANPSVEVRIVGYGDGGNAVERNAALSVGRAQAVGRVLLTDMMIENKIVTVGAIMPQPSARAGSVEVVIRNADEARFPSRGNSGARE
jgi:outer membrane protein OmpA-like peptidoglycan-associated protein